MQMVRAGLKAIYLSGWQVAADANTASAMYPDQSLYPANAAPELAKRINRTLQRADQIETAEGKGLSVDTWFAPIVADAEAGRSEEHTSELQSLMRISYAVFCLKKTSHQETM